jgi:hypothetical protein
VRAGELELEIDTALFGTQAFEALPEDGGEAGLDVSDVLVLRLPAEFDEADGADAAEGQEADSDDDAMVERFVVLVAERTPERLRAFEDVKAQVEASVLAQKRQAERTEWLSGRREEADIVEYSIAGGDFGLPADLFTTDPVTLPSDDAGAASDAAEEEPGVQ